MSASILVAYATRAGSTQEVAEAVATTLRQAGLTVDIQPLRNVGTLEGYQAVVIRAPLYMFRWHKDALGFLKRHQGALKSRPAAVFALGPFRRQSISSVHRGEGESSPKRQGLKKLCSRIFVAEPATSRRPLLFLWPGSRAVQKDSLDRFLFFRPNSQP